MQNSWFSSEIKNLTRQRDVAYLRWKRYKADEFRKQYKEARVKLNKKIKSAKKEHYNIQFNNCVNSKNRWNKLKRLGIGKSDTRYSANGTKGKWRYASSKARLKCATFRR